MTGSPLSAPGPALVGRRVVAYAIDIIVQGLVVGIAAAVTASAVLGRGAPTRPAEVIAALAVVYGVIAAVTIAWVLVYTAMQAGGGSIGQRLCGLVVADESTGAAIGFGRALLRNLLWWCGTLIVVGYFSALFDPMPRHQGWHDRLSRSFVGTRADTGASSAASTSAASAPETAAPYVPMSSPVPPPAPGGGWGSTVDAGDDDDVEQAAAPPAPVPPLSFAPTAPSSPARAIPTTPGLISSVPGVGRAVEEEAPASARLDTALPVDLDLTAVVHRDGAPEPAAAPHGDPDATVAAPPRRPAIVAFTWDTGERVAVYGTTLFGRNPSARDDAAVVAVRDETLSLSKTHFEVGADADGPWVIDRHSTNGTVLIRDGRRTPLEAGVAAPLRAGDRLEFGDRSLLVGEPA